MNNNNETLYAHRPQSGVSLGARKVDDNILISIALTNNGYSRNGNLMPEHVDTFSRRAARGIINNRLNSAANGMVNVRFTKSIPSDHTLQAFMKEFREKLDLTPWELADGESRFADGIVDYINSIIQDIFFNEIEAEAVRTFED